MQLVHPIPFRHSSFLPASFYCQLVLDFTVTPNSLTSNFPKDRPLHPIAQSSFSINQYLDFNFFSPYFHFKSDSTCIYFSN
ncbi:unnamed protein product [Caenorhabditis nigoni]